MKDLNMKHILAGIAIVLIMIPIFIFSPILLILKKLVLSLFFALKLMMKNPKFLIGTKKFFLKHSALKFVQEAGLFIVKKYTNWDRVFKYYTLKLKQKAHRIKRHALKVSKEHKSSVLVTSFFTSTGLGIALYSAWKYIWVSVLGFFFKILIKPLLLILIVGLDLIFAPIFILLYDVLLNFLVFSGIKKFFKKNY